MDLDDFNTTNPVARCKWDLLYENFIKSQKEQHLKFIILPSIIILVTKIQKGIFK